MISYKQIYSGLLVTAVLAGGWLYYKNYNKNPEIINELPDQVSQEVVSTELLPETEEVITDVPPEIEPLADVVSAKLPESKEVVKSDIKPSPINLTVPFTSQAPLFNWKDSRQQDGCEEASALMAMAWVRQEETRSPALWEEQITALADWEQEKYGEHRDVSVEDVINWIFKDYFSYNLVRSKVIGGVADILSELEAGNLVLAPANGQLLGNPNFTAPGPAHHFLVIKGYDYQTKEFITNDPGTRLGADYRYLADILYGALRAYPTGYHGQYDEIKKIMIILEKE